MIDNELTSTAETRRAVDPSTGQPLAEVPISTQADVDRAVAAAQAAFVGWRERSTDDRAEYLLKFADAIEANQEGLGPLLGKETGKPPQGQAIELFHLGSLIRQMVPMRLEEELVEETEDVMLAPETLAPDMAPLTDSLDTHHCREK